MDGSLAQLVAREGVGRRVVDAFQVVDRAEFVPEHLVADAYLDRPVEIPHEQVTSQPSLIARMVDAATIQPGDRVLEIGTGYGFQTAVLAHLAGEVVSVERHSSLADTARRNLERTGVTNVTVIVGDGWQGYPDRAPFEAIVVSAAVDTVPSALPEQLVEGGRLVIPIRSGAADDVCLFVRTSEELERVRVVIPAYFVPLVPGETT